MSESLFKVVEGKVYASMEFLISNGMSESMLDSEMLNYQRGETLDFAFFTNNGDSTIWFCYDSIPKRQLQSIGLPTKSSILTKILEDTDFAVLDKPKYSKCDFYLQQAFHNKYYWTQYIPYYIDYFLDSTSKNLYAKTHSVFKTIIELKKEKDFPMTELFQSMQKLPRLVFMTSNNKSFYRKIRTAEKEGISETLIHSFRQYGREPYKLSRTVRSTVLSFYASPRRCNYKEIQNLTNRKLSLYGMQSISLSSVRKICKSYENQASIIRLGERTTRNNHLPYLNREGVDRVGELFHFDATELNFKYKGEDGSKQNLWFGILLDVHSQKVLGYSFDNSENTKMLLCCFKNAFRANPVIPEEILLDNHPSNGSDLFKKMETKLSDFGIYLRRARNLNPQDKGQIENWFGSFQSRYLNSLFGSLGNGIKSKRVGGRAHPEIEGIYLKKSNLHSKESLMSVVRKCIRRHNNDRLPESRETPNEIFSRGLKNTNKRFKSFHLNYLFGIEKIIQIKRSMIIFKYNKNKYHYTIWNTFLANTYNGKQVLIYFDEHDLSNIDLFDLKSHKFLANIKLNPKVSPVAKTNEEKKVFRQHYTDTIARIEHNIESVFDDIKYGEEELKKLPIVKITKSDELEEVEQYDKDNKSLIKQVTKKYKVSQKWLDSDKSATYRNFRKGKLKTLDYEKVSKRTNT